MVFSKHVIFSGIPFIGILYSKVYPDDGTMFTINLGMQSQDSTSKGGQIARIVSDLSTNKLFIVGSAGNSDNAMSYYFNNM